MKVLLLCSAAVLAAGLVSAADAAPVVIQDGFVQAGVSDYGTLGSDDTNPPGILYDSTGTSTYGINDFLTPGSPFEGFYVTADGGYSQYSNNDPIYGTTFPLTSPTSLTGTSATWTGTSSDGTLTVKNNYSLTTIAGRSVIAINTTLTNNMDVALANLQFLRTLDPDPDVNAFGDYDTNNSVISNDEACGTGTSSGETICIATDSTGTHKAGVSEDWSTDPAEYLAGLDDGNGDYAIGLAFDLGDLAAGGTYTLNYYYALGADKGTASGGSGSAVPEPATIMLLGAGLGGLAFRRRNRKAGN